MAAPASGESDSASVYFVVGIAALVVAVVMVDYYIDELLVVWRYMRLGQLWILSLIPDWVPYFGSLPIDDAYDCLARIEACLGGERLDALDAEKIDNATMAHFSWIPGLFFVILGIKQLMRGESVGATHDMESLLRQNAPLYKNISAFTEAHPERAPLHWNRTHPETAEFGFSVSPERFAKMNPPLGCAKDAKKNSMYMQPIWDGDLYFDNVLAQDVFSRQLGARFAGIENLNCTEKSIFDQLTAGLTFSENNILPILKNVLGKKPNLDLESDRRITAAIEERAKGVQSWLPWNRKAQYPSDEKARTKLLVADKSMDPHYRYALAERIMHQHGFVITGLMSLLEEARQGGVVAGCELLWVKRKSRNLWYALSSVGRKVAFTEGAGSYAHWLIERHLNRPLTHPEVHEAVVGLELALKMDIRRANAQEASA